MLTGCLIRSSRFICNPPLKQVHLSRVKPFSVSHSEQQVLPKVSREQMRHPNGGSSQDGVGVGNMDDDDSTAKRNKNLLSQL